ncbi:hypothetical protein [Bacillus cereus]|uniref:Uncharacterized protein n=1 Tax=Bacillus cereus VD184 TaxID=1053242 RepID=A0A9W5R2E0_BACCE|nr:hypothetical protein [Bacillus cereus]EOQ04517.1 hypothetical protein IKC_06019 [Bacillus cereus VD184]
MKTHTKKVQNPLRKKYNEEYLMLQKKWHAVDKELFSLGKIAYWTQWTSMHINRLNEMIKTTTDEIQKRQYQEQRQNLYALKNQAVILLSQSPYATIQIYMPTVHKKLCAVHQQQIHKQSLTIHDALLTMHQQFSACSNCQKGQRNFYSLYAIDIKHKETNTHFRFHMPYALFYPNINQKSNQFPRIEKYHGDFGMSKIPDSLEQASNLFRYELVVKKLKENLAINVKEKNKNLPEGTEAFLPLNSILLGGKHLNSIPRQEKQDKVAQTIQKTGTIDKPILIDKETKMLKDDFSRYFVAREMKLERVPVRYK